MPSTYTTRARLEKQAPGENNNTWGALLNTNTIDMIDQAVNGMASYAVTGAVVLTSNNGASDQARCKYQNITGGTGGTVTIPNVEKTYIVRNGAAGTVTFTTGGGTTADILTGALGIIVCEGGNVCRNLLASILTGNVVANGTLSCTGNATLGDADADITSVNGTLKIKHAADNVTVAMAGGAANEFWINAVDTPETGFKTLAFRATQIDLRPGGTTYFSVSAAGISVPGPATFNGATLFKGVYNTRIEGGGTTHPGATGNGLNFIGDATNGYSYITTNIGLILLANEFRFSSIASTAIAANACFSGAGGDSLLKVSSSLRYKKDIKALAKDAARDIIMALNPITYVSKFEYDGPGRHYGFIAEEVVEIEPRLATFILTSDDYEKPTKGSEVAPLPKKGAVPTVPDGVQYERIIVPLIAYIQQLEARLQAAGI